jgi:energy-coupling factor transporter ATP-binding protein EcfA2
MNSTSNTDSPANGFRLDRIMIKDERGREEAARKHTTVWDQGVKIVRDAVKANNAGHEDRVADESRGPGRHKAGEGKKAVKAARRSKSHARPSAPPEPRTEPLRTLHNEEQRFGQLQDSVQTSSKKRNWEQYTPEESPQKLLHKSNDTVHITGKRRRPIEVITLSSSEDDLPKPSVLPHSRHTDTHSMEASEKHTLQTAVIDLASANNGHESQARHLTPSVTFLPSHLPADSTAEPPLCHEQSALVDLILSGRNVFYTGSAGCGKSTVLKAFVKQLKEHPTRPKKVDIIAPTGRAALDINGSTFWTYAGWTPDHMKKPVQDLRRAAHGKFVKKRLQETDVLVIDEVSMVENHHFERLNQVMKEARGNDRPFGGVQLVITGDFCQLPPVKPFQFCLTCGSELQQDASGTVYTCSRHGTFRDSDKWAFMSTAWEECQFEHVNLTNIHRQSDEIFIAILQKCRLGIPLSPKDEDLLLNHDSQTGNAVRLFSTREEVRVVNKTAFNRLPVRFFLTRLGFDS